MDIIDKINKTATNGCKKTVNKTNKMAQRTKLRMHINECKRQIEYAYCNIGKKVYEKHVREENIDIKKDLNEECEYIDKLSHQIENAIEHILILKNMKKCPQCFSEIMIDYNFCPICGEKQNNKLSKEKQILQTLNEQEISDDNEKETDIIKEEKQGD